MNRRLVMLAVVVVVAGGFGYAVGSSKWVLAAVLLVLLFGASRLTPPRLSRT